MNFAPLRAAAHRLAPQRNAPHRIATHHNPQGQDMKPPSFELSADTRFLRQRLERLAPGEQVSYLELSGIISKPVAGATPALQSAKKGLLKDGYVFSPIHGHGIQRLDDNQVVSAFSKGREHIRRMARREGEKLSTASSEKLTPQNQIAQAIGLAVSRAIAEISSENSSKRLGSRLNGSASELPIAETLKALLP